MEAGLPPDYAGLASMAWSSKAKPPKPTYAYIHDGEFELLDASEVWGKGVHDTIKHFKEKYGEKDLTVITIGPAGENLVKFACWMNEDDRASWARRHGLCGRLQESESHRDQGREEDRQSRRP